MSALFIVGTITGFMVNYCHQNLVVADYSYPVRPPIAKVSIIIPAFNEESCIERLLSSLFSQNIVQQYPEMFEFIVVDNESTDNTAGIAHRYAKVVSAPRGKLNAKNFGAEIAAGEILVFIDADSFARPNFLNLLLRHFQDDAVVAAGGSVLTPDPNIVTAYLEINVNQINSLVRHHLPGGAAAIRKDVYFSAGGHFTDIDQFDRHEIWVEEEVDFLGRVKQFGKVIIDQQATLLFEERLAHCGSYMTGQCNEPNCSLCKFCQEKITGERF